MIALAVLAVVGFFLLWYYWQGKLAEKEFRALFSANGNPSISELTISGRQRSVSITDQETVLNLERSFRIPASGTLRLGLVYDVSIKFKSGRKFNTYIYIHDDANGFTIADPSETHAGDPRMIMLRFDSSTDRKVQGLVVDLSKSR